MPSVEMGQGIYTAEAVLLAEELDVGLDQVDLVAAPPDTLLYAQPLFKAQMTGGSTSIRGFWTPLRQAGATARAMPQRLPRTLERAARNLLDRPGHCPSRGVGPQYSAIANSPETRRQGRRPETCR